VLFHRDCFLYFCCLFRKTWKFSTAYLLKLFLLSQHAITTLFVKFDKPELTRWCLCSLHAGIQMSSDEMVCCRDSCCHSVAEGTADVPIRLLWQISMPALRCSHTLFRNLQSTSNLSLIFVRHLATDSETIHAIAAELSFPPLWCPFMSQRHVRTSCVRAGLMWQRSQNSALQQCRSLKCSYLALVQNSWLCCTYSKFGAQWQKNAMFQKVRLDISRTNADSQ